MDNGSGPRLKRAYLALCEFLAEKRIASHEESQATRLHRFAHFWLLVFKSFARNKCPLRATALAYTTLLAIVPLLALAVSVSSSLLQGEEGVKRIELFVEKIVAYAAPQLDLVAVESSEGNVDAANAPPKIKGSKKVAKDISGFVGKIRTGTLGVTGMASLIIVGIMLLSTVEATFNDIWGITHGRSWFARIVQYWAAISLGPIIVLLAVGLATGPHLDYTQKLLGGSPLFKDLVSPILSFLVISVGFALFYKLMPNTQVHWSAALLAGVVGGCVWLLQNILQAFTVTSAVGKMDIYGPLAVLPIFLVGLYFSWLILLFGAQVAYALQNRQVYLQERKAESVNQSGREFVALRLMTLVAERFEHQKPPPTVLEMAGELAVPSRLLMRIIPLLLEAGLLVEVSGKETAYAPARPLAKITSQDILHSLRAGGGQEMKTRDGVASEKVRGEFQRIQEAENRAASAVTLEELVKQIPPEQK